MPKNYQKLALLKSILFGTDVLTLNSAELQHSPQKKTIFNKATNHQTLTLTKNLCFGTVVPAINSAEYNLDAGKQKKISSAQKSSKVVIVE